VAQSLKAQGKTGGGRTLKFEDGTKKHNKTITRGHRTPSPVGHWRKVENNKLPWGQSDCGGAVWRIWGFGGVLVGFRWVGGSEVGSKLKLKCAPPQAQVFDGARSCCVCVPSDVTGLELLALLAKGRAATEETPLSAVPAVCPSLRLSTVSCVSMKSSRHPGNLPRATTG